MKLRERPSGLTVMTYNVRNCTGWDGKTSTVRVGDVIAQYDPDVVALQELDMGRKRSGGADQPFEIARHLNMDFHFSPAFSIEEEKYGNAILSRLPMKLVRAAPLPALGGLRERRGALWVSVMLGDVEVHVVNTHLGLNWLERKLQAEALLGPEWLGGALCRPPLILCGDFNLLPTSMVYQSLCARLADAQLEYEKRTGRRPQRTWPSFLPMTRLDHIFFSGEFEVRDVFVPRNSLSRGASDHLPLAASLELVRA